ncbi:tetratricopeptide repeat-containing glycosyltransferase family protein [Caballeronia sp. LZ029]|uniref:tetratricopeptide repeat-containing glycosyltransferase family protein n=1 Tax=Caballeronia sp. LZ029 TaxID=3038564 RepID=UPI002862D45F|nr:tetratricopeptide repeat-containing glycosyltransferase family protein [Caballeronia sp. LZ029]MDR5745999.1 tetratricopeptide repeat-containing glycosyltransferase family protein [Caballeronia sp. LZ029]
MIAQDMKQDVEAKACLEHVTQILPSPQSFLALSVALLDCGEFERAATAARAGLALSTGEPAPLETSALFNNLGEALLQAANYEEAAQAYRNVISLTPDHGVAHQNLGNILTASGQIDAAIELLEHAVKIIPDVPIARVSLSQALLRAGRLEEAWPHFEYRWASIAFPSGQRITSRPALPIQLWDGAFEDSRDQHLLVVTEQGLGDMLQFCRYLPMVLERFAKVGFACPKPLHRLLAQSLGTRWSNLVLFEDIPSDFWEWDRYILLMSMPGAFRTELDTIPAPIPYLSADPRAMQQFASRLEKLGCPSLPRIGLAWAGGHSELSIDRFRSIPTDQLGPLIDWPHACWVSIQKPENDEKRLRPDQRTKVVDWMDEMEDFADTAALIANLDLVISVDTSVAHLAAAMGKPVWLLNRFAGCWRWLHNRDDSPWYPTMRIFTQRERGNWNEVFERVVDELERMR